MRRVVAERRWFVLMLADNFSCFNRFAPVAYSIHLIIAGHCPPFQKQLIPVSVVPAKKCGK